MAPRRALARAGIGLLWTLVIIAMSAGMFIGAAVGGSALGRVLLPPLPNGDADVGPTVVAAMIIAGGVASVVCYRARRWLLRLRLHQCDTHALAAVVWTESRYVPGRFWPGSTVYTIYLSCPALLQGQIMDREYRFVVRGPADFTCRIRQAEKLAISFPASQPHRFVVDIPYTPRMADLFI